MKLDRYVTGYSALFVNAGYKLAVLLWIGQVSIVVICCSLLLCRVPIVQMDPFALLHNFIDELKSVNTVQLSQEEAKRVILGIHL